MHFVEIHYHLTRKIISILANSILEGMIIYESKSKTTKIGNIVKPG